MRRGDINLAGTELTFTEGSISFNNGGSVADPSLHLVATSSSASVTPTLTIGSRRQLQADGDAEASVPQLPQDEILAHLLFGTGTGSLGPLQVAGIAASLASLTGVGGGIGDPLSSGAARASGWTGYRSVTAPAEVQACRPAAISPGAYMLVLSKALRVVALKQRSRSISQGAQTAGHRRYRLTSATGAGGTAGASSTGSSVGLTYQFEY